jgi:hypothetical protein
MPVHVRKQRYPKLVAFRAPATVTEALVVAADQRLTSASEYARQALVAALRADGVVLPPAKSA